MKYFRLKDSMYALDAEKRMLYSVSTNTTRACATVSNISEGEVQYFKGWENDKQLTAEEFQKAFSEAVDFLHNQTPFA